MSPQAFRHYLQSLGYTVASQRLLIENPSHAKALASAWKVWEKSPGRAKSAIEICGVAIPTVVEKI